ncbi:hypothetical protein BDA96_10G089200 [Sorghum bicolor]|uniref:Uncharacterized protein n=1 Tax=Sorghum bicolor TaxID=4558 RepID=A0A921U054_SORBI|nr:hypothetical protein BDA96_10G089200 [Sorghum bicolor]
MEAGSLYKQMVRVGEKENDSCFTNHGKMVRCRIMKSRFCFQMMYFKCGRLAAQLILRLSRTQ